MPRFFVYKKLNINEEIELSGDDAHHILRVLRYRPGDIIKISDGKNVESMGKIEDVNFKELKIKLKIVEQIKYKDKKLKLTLLQGLPKREKFEWILQKNTEIGVTKFVPVISNRTVPDIAPSKLESRYRRWKKIVYEASKQCMRMDVPDVLPLMTFDESLEEIKKHQLSIIFWEKEDKMTLKKLFSKITGKLSEIAIFIGPEGGFSEDEIKKAKDAGAITVSLGPRILRTETAAVITCGIITYELGEMGGV